MPDNESPNSLETLNRELALKAHDRTGDDMASARKAAIESANVAIRSLILVNGGAVLALLTFIASLETGSSGGSIKLEDLVAPVQFFAMGVGFSAVTAALAYLVNMLDSDIYASFRLTWDHPFVIDDQKNAWRRYLRGFLHVSALLLAISSLVVFFCGVYAITGALTGLGL